MYDCAERMSGLRDTYRAWLPVDMADGSVLIVVKPLPDYARPMGGAHVPVGKIVETGSDGDGEPVYVASLSVIGDGAAKLFKGLPVPERSYVGAGLESEDFTVSAEIRGGSLDTVARRVDQFLTWLLDWPSEDPESQSGSESKTAGGWRSSFRQPDTEQA